MRLVGYGLSVLMLALGSLAAAWGVVLLWTLDREFQPRGSVGVVLVVAGITTLMVGGYGVHRLSRPGDNRRHGQS